MISVWLCTFPPIFFGMYNIGLQANTAIALGNGAVLEGWRESLIMLLGGGGHDAASLWDNISFGAAYFLPVDATTFIVGGFWEVLFATIRRHEVNEGFFVTSILDRKSTRLNSSHVRISYAVFCLKKKKINKNLYV